jgi:hypothetical protein
MIRSSVTDEEFVPLGQ